MTTREELRNRGDAIRKKTRAMGSDADTAPGYQRMVSEALYGGIWARDALCRLKIVTYASCRHSRYNRTHRNFESM